MTQIKAQAERDAIDAHQGAQGMRLKQLPDAIGASKNTIWRALSGLGAYA